MNRPTRQHRHTAPVSTGRLAATAGLNFAITAAEVVGGLLSGSLSLLSDALHNFADGLSVALAYLAVRLARRRKSLSHTFGFKRAEILAAAVNAAALAAITAYLFYGAIRRLLAPAAVDGGIMTAVGLIALVTNATGTLLLRADSGHSLNVRSAYLHLLSDSVSSAGVALAGLAISRWRAVWLDPVLTLLIGLYVLREAYGILAETVHVLLEGTPPGLDLQALREAVESVPGVVDVHHVHVWSVGEHDVHLDAHLNVRDMSLREADALRRNVEAVLRASFEINHPTIQLECGPCSGIGLIAP